MYKLKSTDKVVQDDGIMFAFEGIKGFDPRVLEGQTVDIDGHACKVVSVGTFLVNDPTGFNFGLLVKG